MAFIPVPNTCQVAFEYLAKGQQLINTLYFEQANPFNVSDMTTLASELDTWHSTHLAPQLAVDAKLQNIKLTSLENNTAPVYELPISPARSGGIAASPLPNHCTFAIKFLTAQRGRSFRGRNYIPLLPDTKTLDNSVDQTWADALVAAYDEIFNIPSFSTPFLWVVVSRYSAGLPRSPGISTPVTDVAYTDLTIDSQRRRLPGRGV